MGEPTWLLEGKWIRSDNEREGGHDCDRRGKKREHDERSNRGELVHSTGGKKKERSMVFMKMNVAHEKKKKSS